MSQPPGADELRIRATLIKQGVGPDADPAALIPPKPTRPPRDWLDDILDSNPAPAPSKPEAEPKPPREPKPPVKNRPAADKGRLKKAAGEKQPNGRSRRQPPTTRARSIIAAQKAASTVTKRIPGGRRINKKHTAYTAYWLTAAATGWGIGLEPWFASCLDYYVGNGGAGTATLVVLAVVVLAVDSRTHGLRSPARHVFTRAIGWVGRIPLASAVLALALYNTR